MLNNNNMFVESVSCIVSSVVLVMKIILVLVLVLVGNVILF